MAGCAGTPPLSYPQHSGHLGSFGTLLPGQAQFVQVMVPAPASAVTLVSARALPVPGLPAPGPRITRIGVWSYPGAVILFGPGYPPHGACAERGVLPRSIPCRPGWKLDGFRIRAGDHNKMIYFWITVPRRAGNYYLAGLAVTYRSGGQRYTVNLYTLAEYCVACGRSTGRGCRVWSRWSPGRAAVPVPGQQDFQFPAGQRRPAAGGACLKISAQVGAGVVPGDPGGAQDGPGVPGQFP